MSVFETSDSISGNDVVAKSSSMFTHRHSFSFHVGDERYLNVETASMGDLKLSRVSSSGHTVKLTETENVTYLLPRHGSLNVTTRTGEFCARAGGAMVFSPNSRLTRVRPGQHGRFQAMALLVPVEIISDLTDIGRNSMELYRLDSDMPATMSVNQRAFSHRLPNLPGVRVWSRRLFLCRIDGPGQCRCSRARFVLPVCIAMPDIRYTHAQAAWSRQELDCSVRNKLCKIASQNH